jgi:hypothetical protein
LDSILHDIGHDQREMKAEFLSFEKQLDHRLDDFEKKIDQDFAQARSELELMLKAEGVPAD